MTSCFLILDNLDGEFIYHTLVAVLRRANER